MSELQWTEAAMVLGLGLGAGILSGMFGIGGGLVIVPFLILVFGFDPKTAVGTSLFALLLPTGLLGVAEYWRRGELRLAPGLLLALGLFCGAYFGARLTGSISAAAMKRAYAVFLIVVASYFLWTSTPPRRQPPKPVEPSPIGAEKTARSDAQDVH
jgi:uncharacterized membrane protein YfcA